MSYDLMRDALKDLNLPEGDPVEAIVCNNEFVERCLIGGELLEICLKSGRVLIYTYDDEWTLYYDSEDAPCKL